MKLYRFSPISSSEELVSALTHIHWECMKLCFSSFWEYFPVAGNIGIFCHFEEEYNFLKGIQREICDMKTSVFWKYYTLKNPILIPEYNGIPEWRYTHLYIRKPDPYRAQVGDTDFLIQTLEYQKYKKSLQEWNLIPWARIFPRADLDMIELFHPESDVLWYVRAN